MHNLTSFINQNFKFKLVSKSLVIIFETDKICALNLFFIVIHLTVHSPHDAPHFYMAAGLARTKLEFHYIYKAYKKHH